MRNLAAFALALAFAACMLALPGAYALSVSVTQAGADSDEVMKDNTFTVEAGGWTGSCSQATISFTGCSSCSLSGEDTVKSISGGADSVSWTTISASQLASAQSISVSVSSGCTLQQADSSSFDIVLPPSISVSATTSESSVTAGGSFSANINIVNSGETTARDTTIDVSGTGITGSCSAISSIDEGQSAAESCTVTADTAGTQTVTFTASSTNTDSASDSFDITVSSSGGTPPGGGSTGGGGGGVASGIKETANIGSIAAGASGTAQFYNSLLAVTQIVIIAKNAAEHVAVTAEQNSTRPSAASLNPTGKVYGYLTLTALNMKEQNMTAATIKFRVNRTWMANNNVSQGQIVLKRFSGNALHDVDTSLYSSDDKYYYYIAVTPGFSVFAITVKAAAAPEEGGEAAVCNNNGVCDAGETTANCPADCPAQQPPQPPAGGEQPPAAGFVLTPVLMVVLGVIVGIAIIAVAYLFMRKDRKKPGLF